MERSHITAAPSVQSDDAGWPGDQPNNASNAKGVAIMPPTRDGPPHPEPSLGLLRALLQSRNLNAYALIVFGGIAFALKMPESIYGGLILGGLAILKAGA